MNSKMFIRSLLMVFFLSFALLITGCGGGGGGTAPAPTGAGTVSGTAIKGPVSGGTVTAFAINQNGTQGAQIGTAVTDSQGNFSMNVGSHSGPFMLQMTGGNFMDEATGAQMSMGSDKMTAAIPDMIAGSTISGIQITPVTSMAQTMAENMSGGMTQANMTQANTAMGQFFGVSDILTVHPMDPTVAGSGTGASQDQRNHGMTIAAMSQFAKDIGMPDSSGMVTAMMNDASDGTMNGKMAGGSAVGMGGGMPSGTMMQPNAGTTGLSTAMADFLASGANKSGLNSTDMAALINKLATSNGQIITGGTGGMMSGTVTKGPVSGATVTAFAINSNGTKGAQIGTATTDAQGNFSMNVGNHSGAVMVQATGGTFMDEATGTQMTMTAAMTAAIPNMTAGSTLNDIQVTPVTSMAQAMAQNMTGGMTQANITRANTAMGNFFGISNILMTHPMDFTVAGSGATASQDQRNHGMIIAAMSQSAKEIGMPDSSGMVTAMMSDASDGRMDGMMGGSQINMGGMGGMMGGTMMQPTAGTSGLGTAMNDFLSSGANKSGLTFTEMQTLINKMMTTSGQIL